jgi:hypothetical protein
MSGHTPEPVAYTVTATLPDQTTVERYLAWLTQGHVQQVVAGGASSALVIRLSDPPLSVQSRYQFPTPEAYQGYLRDHAPRLRAEGLALFGPHNGVVFRRELGTIVSFDP